MAKPLRKRIKRLEKSMGHALELHEKTLEVFDNTYKIIADIVERLDILESDFSGEQREVWKESVLAAMKNIGVDIYGKKSSESDRV